MAKVILGVSGFAGSGKDTLADHLVDEYGFYKISQAAPMKRACQDIFGFSNEQLWGPSKFRNEPDERYLFSGDCPSCFGACDPLEEDGDDYWWCTTCRARYHKYLTPRLALQTLGTEWGRTLCRDVWIDRAIREILESDHDRWVLPDIRFRNEVKGVRKAGGYLVRLLRGTQAFTHSSEAEMAEMGDELFDFVIDNDREKEFLYEMGGIAAERAIHGR